MKTAYEAGIKDRVQSFNDKTLLMQWAHIEGLASHFLVKARVFTIEKGGVHVEYPDSNSERSDENMHGICTIHQRERSNTIAPTRDPSQLSYADITKKFTEQAELKRTNNFAHISLSSFLLWM